MHRLRNRTAEVVGRITAPAVSLTQKKNESPATIDGGKAETVAKNKPRKRHFTIRTRESNEE